MGNGEWIMEMGISCVSVTIFAFSLAWAFWMHLLDLARLGVDGLSDQVWWERSGFGWLVFGAEE